MCSGQHMLARLTAIKSPVVKAVRGRGLWATAEIKPNLVTAREVCERLLANEPRNLHRDDVPFL